MPNLVVMPSGVKAAFSNTNPRGGGRRGAVVGWSEGSARRCDLFLRSVIFQRIEAAGFAGFALTLTLAQCPPSFRHWQQCVRAYLDRLNRRGLQLAHFVTEWQRRGRFATGAVPHLHLVVFFRDALDVRWSDGFAAAVGEDALRVHWLEIADDFGPLLVGQHCVPVVDLRGWFRYLAKHAARGVRHYQRDPDTIPKGWDKTGRMWGTRGDWPVSEVRARITAAGFYQLRRFANRYLLAQARCSVALAHRRLASARGPRQLRDAAELLRLSQRRVSFLKRQLVRSSPKIARLVPISEWVPASLVVRWLDDFLHCVEGVDPETGEFVKHYFRPGERNAHGLGLTVLASVHQGWRDA